MIKTKYLVEKLVEQKETGTFHERREYKDFWRKRIGSVHSWRNNGRAVLLCGRISFAADVLGITLEKTPLGIEDVVSGELCYDIECCFLSSELDRLSVFLSEKLINDGVR